MKIILDLIRKYLPILVVLLLICWSYTARSGLRFDPDVYCGRDCVLGLVEDYVDALVKHDLRSLNFAENLRSTENGKYIKPSTGIGQTITSRESYSQAFVDQDLGDAVFFGAFREGDEAVVAGNSLQVRIRSYC